MAAACFVSPPYRRGREGICRQGKGLSRSDEKRDGGVAGGVIVMRSCISLIAMKG